jgi:hypothetical protein
MVKLALICIVHTNFKMLGRSVTLLLRRNISDMRYIRPMLLETDHPTQALSQSCEPTPLGGLFQLLDEIRIIGRVARRFHLASQDTILQVVSASRGYDLDEGWLRNQHYSCTDPPRANTGH